MANVAFTLNGVVQYLTSVNTPDYPGALVNPDLLAVSGVERRYWKIDNGAVVEMTSQEKAAIDSTQLTERRNSANTFESDSTAIFTALIKVINIRLPAGQKITKQELIDAVKAEIV